jgi:class 3 adenylate cyclase
MQAPIAYREYQGTVLFLVVDRIKEMDGSNSFSCIVQLQRVLNDNSLVKTIGKSWVGTTVSGAFVFIPDETNLIPHAYLVSLFSASSGLGIPMRCGVTWGRALCFEDADREENFVGRAINVAARLAYSKENPGCLIESSYEEYAKGFSATDTEMLLEGAPAVVIKGKKHDGVGFKCRSIDKARLSIIDEATPGSDKNDQQPIFASGLVLAYDLPHFSEGDESQLSKRVRSLVDTLRSLTENHASLRLAEAYFCPGGDGGILLWSNVREDAVGVSKQLAQRLVVESEHKESSIAIEARLGVHYGVVTLYSDVRGRLRPTGTTCFIADDLISDAASKAAGIVFSDSLRAAISHGSHSFLIKEFQQLPTLIAGPAAGIARFTPRHSDNAEFRHPLVEQLFGRTSNWQPEGST